MFIDLGRRFIEIGRFVASKRMHHTHPPFIVQVSPQLSASAVAAAAAPLPDMPDPSSTRAADAAAVATATTASTDWRPAILGVVLLCAFLKYDQHLFASSRSDGGVIKGYVKTCNASIRPFNLFFDLKSQSLLVKRRTTEG